MEFLGTWNHACSSVGLACRNGDYALLKSLLKAGRSVDVQDNRGWRPIHEAVASHHVDCLQLLIQQDSNDVNWRSFEGETPLLLAARNGDEEMVQLLLKNEADPNLSNNEDESPLYFATMCHNLACVKLLVEAEADVNHKDFSSDSALHAAVTISDLPITTFLVEKGAKLDCRNSFGMTPIFTAAYNGSFECLQFLLLKAKDAGMHWLVDAAAEDNATPLMLAAQCGHFECVKLLLDNGADPNRRVDDALALHMAVEKGHLDCVKLLLLETERSALLLSENSFPPVSAVNLAIARNRSEVLKHLLEAGFSANVIFKLQWVLYDKSNEAKCLDDFIQYCRLKKMISALGVAVAMHSSECVMTLITAGCEINPKPAIISPLTVAVLLGYTDITDILLTHGANPNYPEIGPLECGLPLIAAARGYNHQCLRLLLKAGGDPRHCFPDGAEHCQAIIVHNVSQESDYDIIRKADVFEEGLGFKPVTYYLSENHLMFKGFILPEGFDNVKVAAVFEEFLGHRPVTYYVTERQLIFKGFIVPENDYWKFRLKSDVPYSLEHQCRLKIRECIMDNGNKVPLPKQLGCLPVPDKIVQYLKFEC